jgi:chromosome segregation ATPase
MSQPPNDRLEAISTELADILEHRIQELMDIMRVTEATTRQIVSTELEIARGRATREALGAELSTLEAEVQELRKRAGTANASYAALVEERRGLRDSVTAREREVRELTTQVEDLRRSQVNFEAEGESLRRENAELGSRVRALEENVKRLRTLKDELMTNLSGLSQQMPELRIGTK